MRYGSAITDKTKIRRSAMAPTTNAITLLRNFNGEGCWIFTPHDT